MVTIVLIAGITWGQEQPAKVPAKDTTRKVIDINETDTFGLRGEGMESPGYKVTWYPSRSVSKPRSQGDFEMTRHEFSMPVPLWIGERDILALSTGMEYTRFSTGAILPDSHRPFPDDVWNVQLGLNYLRKGEDGRLYGVVASVGSPSDKPFRSFDEIDLGFVGLLQMPARKGRDAWRFMLIYAPSSEVIYPIPGIAYLWNPSDALHVSIGLPPALLWRPTDRWTVNLSYLPPAAANARATYRLLDTLFVYGGFETLEESYLLADRDKRRDRFMGFEERLVAGVRWDFWPYLSWETKGGYAFERSYGVGESWFEDLDDKVDIDPTPFLSTGLCLRF
jgi:hypothetical protein